MLVHSGRLCPLIDPFVPIRDTTDYILLSGFIQKESVHLHKAHPLWAATQEVDMKMDPLQKHTLGLY